jgi:predicted Fe-Mo cluster-binding NifX family protein
METETGKEGEKMRVAITSQGDDLEGNVDGRFGRAAKFLLVDTDTMSLQVIENTQSLNLARGAGIQAAQNVIPHKPDVVLTGNCGPKAFKVLQAAGVKVILGAKGKIRDALQDYVEGKLQPAKEANVEGHWV